MPRRRRPRLDPQVVADADKLWAAINELLIGDAAYKGFRKQIVRRQEQLRRLVDDEGWRAYLKVEEAVNARAEHVAMLLVRWAFDDGASWGRRKADA